jgi:signal peptidase II
MQTAAMRSHQLSRVAVIVLIIFANVGCDQISKKMVRSHLGVNETIQLLQSHFLLMRVENSGAFLSVGDSLSTFAKHIFLSALPLLALAFASVYIFAKQSMSQVSLISICFIIGGGLGNLYDRIAHGSVTDFLYIHWGIFQTGIFNMADLSITTGALIILVQSIFRRLVVRQ